MSVLASTTMPASRPAILVVEDEAIIALDLQMQLEDLGYDVVGVADTAASALDLAERHRPDLTLMDVVLRGEGDGIDAAAAMQKRGGMPVIFLTSFSDSNTVRRAAETAPYGYLTKPFQVRELHAGIEVALVKARLERQLRDAERWYASTLRCVQDGILITDPQGRIRFLNRAAETMIGQSLDEVRGQPVDAVLCYTDPLPTGELAGTVTAEPGTSALLDALHLGRVVGVRHARHVQRLDGSKMPVDEWAGTVQDDQGECLGGVLVLRDVSDRIASSAALRSKDEYLASVSHEMRTPLNAVIGFAQLLRMQTTTPDSAPTNYADHILNAGQHLLALVDDVLDLHTDSQPAEALQTSALSLVRVIDAALSLVQPLAAKHDVTMSHAIDPGVLVCGDERRLRQVLINLASNAVKYNRAGGSVVCSARMVGQRVRIEVQDTGIGMTAEQLAGLFKPFDRLGREASSVPGTGIGLVITRKLVEQMHGQLTIAAADECGTLATVELAAPDAAGS